MFVCICQTVCRVMCDKIHKDFHRNSTCNVILQLLRVKDSAEVEKEFTKLRGKCGRSE